MGTSAIVSISQSDITTIQNDINELSTKLNALITDVSNLSDKISSGYTPDSGSNSGTGNASDSILTRLQNIDADIVTLDSALNTHIGNAGQLQGVKDSDGNNILIYATMNSSSDPHGADQSRNSSRTGSSTSGTLVPISSPASSTATSSSVVGSYGSEDQSVISVNTQKTLRARKLSRQTLNRLRK